MLDSFDNLSNYDSNNSENTFNSSSTSTSRSDNGSNSLAKESNQEQINFINFTQQYCIGFIDIINSTQETAKIKDPKKLRKYYSLFLNSMSSILNQYNGKIIKNSGLKVLNKQHYLINPIYKYKFGLQPRKQLGFITQIPFLRNFVTTCVYYTVG